MQTSFEDASKKLLEWARKEATLGLPEGKSTRRQVQEHFRKKLAQSGMAEAALDERFPELVEVPVPPEVQHIKWAFLELNSARQQGFSGPQPISFMEMQAYTALTGEALSPDEVRTIKGMDVVFLDVIHEYQQKQSKAKDPQ